MPTPSRNAIPLAAALLLLALPGPAGAADPVYKCVKNGKASYTANPTAADGQCQTTEIREDGPKPAELARLLEEKKRRQEEQRQADAAALKARQLRAMELQAEAQERRARAVEEQLLLLRQQQTQPDVIYPGYYYPYGGIIAPPRPPIAHPVPPAPQPPPSPPVRQFRQ